MIRPAGWWLLTTLPAQDSAQELIFFSRPRKLVELRVANGRCHMSFAIDGPNASPCVLEGPFRVFVGRRRWLSYGGLAWFRHTLRLANVSLSRAIFGVPFGLPALCGQPIAVVLSWHSGRLMKIVTALPFSLPMWPRIPAKFGRSKAALGRDWPKLPQTWTIWAQPRPSSNAFGLSESVRHLVLDPRRPAAIRQTVSRPRTSARNRR